MCLVIDTSVFGSVFRESAKKHEDFKPVLRWIVDGDGKLIYGGTKYANEVKGSTYTRILKELGVAGKLRPMPKIDVDKVCAELKKKIPVESFDDEHIVALVIVSRCCVVCTGDDKSEVYLLNKDLYPYDLKVPKIYKRAKDHGHLCCEENIVKVCQ